MAGKTRKDDRLDLRLSRENKELIEQAARLTEKSMTGFIMEASLRDARHVVTERMRLNEIMARSPSQPERKLIFVERTDGGYVFSARRNLDVETVLSEARSQKLFSSDEIARHYGLSKEAVEEATAVIQSERG